MPGSSVEFIYFDMGNVLLRFDHERAVQAVARATGAPASLVRHVIFGSGLELRYERGELSTDEFHEEFCRRTDSSLSMDELVWACSDIFEPIDAMHELVRQLKLGGHRLGVLSNTCDAHWRFVYPERYAELWSHFERFALSFELRSLKPEPDIYRQAATLAEVVPERIFFVDDRDENVDAARRAGFDAVLFTTAGQLSGELRARGLMSSEIP